MKALPKGTIMIGAEMQNKLNLGYVIYPFAVIIMEICKKLVGGFCYSFGETVNSTGQYQIPHVCFPLYQTIDYFIRTPPGSAPPILGRDIPESDEDVLVRKNSIGNIDLNLEDTYTFSFHSNYFDFAAWTLCNVPGIKTCDLKYFFGKQAVQFVGYDLSPDYGKTSAVPPLGVRGGDVSTTIGANVPHLKQYVNYKKYVFKLDVSHTSVSEDCSS